MNAYENMSKETIKVIAETTGNSAERQRMEPILRLKRGRMPKCIYNLQGGKLK